MGHLPFSSLSIQYLHTSLISFVVLIAGEKKGEKKKKRVHFADDVGEPIRRGREEIGRVEKDVRVLPRMPANRMALYN